MTKSKSMTIAMIVMGILLAAAVAATITLAAFNVTRSVSNTVTFKSGVKIAATAGVSDAGKWKVNSVSVNGTIGSAATLENATNGVAFEQITVKNESADKIVLAFEVSQLTVKIDDEHNKANAGLYVTTADANSEVTGYQVSKATAMSGTNYSAVEVTTNTTTASETTWVLVEIEAGTSATLTNIINTVYSNADVNDLADAVASLQIRIAAVFGTIADNTTDIQEAIATGDFTAFETATA